ncbi:hypothetical protein EV138_5699 [Kribbella voronezhensis]|uniref:Lipoprotein n=1 Tax=Kribbella voronezhensis TaxID=2512212 RepID=A0A4R7SXP0_9ACTN|nr:hypothetical protein [Kribbella voronezhensis]TDU83237.1 hypothetical protein EV138_5699 [Kribbella voronezhensis]
MRLLAVLLVTALVVTGCSTVDSADIRTSGMTADLLVQLPENGHAAELTASFRVGTLTYVELSSGEKVTASAQGLTEELRRAKFAGATRYTGQLEATAPGTEFTFTLERDGDNTSAPSSTVALPEPVHLAAPVAGAKLSRRTAVQVRVAGGPSQLLTWSGPCVQTGNLEIESGRSFATIAVGLIRAVPTASASPRSGDSGTCHLTLTLTRRTTGKLDGAFKNGTVVAEAQSVRQVVSMP